MANSNASKDSATDARVRELQGMCGLNAAACRTALRASGGDVGQALAALIDSGAVTDNDLDPDTVSDELFGRAAQRKYDASFDQMTKSMSKASNPMLKMLPRELRGDFVKEMTRLTEDAKKLKADGAAAKLYVRSSRRIEALKKHPVTLKLPPFPRLTLTASDWVGSDMLKTWAGFGERRGSKGNVTINISRPLFDNDDVHPVRPAPEMVAAYAHLKKNEAEVRDAVLQAVRSYINDTLIGEYSWDIEPITDVKALKTMMTISAVHALPVAKGGMSYLGLFFQCTWDPEHAAGVLLHGSRVIKVGDWETSGDEFAAKDDGGKVLRAWKR